MKRVQQLRKPRLGQQHFGAGRRSFETGGVGIGGSFGGSGWRHRLAQPSYSELADRSGAGGGHRGECRSGRTGGREVCPAGSGIGLLLLLPFVFLRSLGAGDWKLAGALGAFVGPGVLLDLLMGSIFVAGIMALGW